MGGQKGDPKKKQKTHPNPPGCWGVCGGGDESTSKGRDNGQQKAVIGKGRPLPRRRNSRASFERAEIETSGRKQQSNCARGKEQQRQRALKCQGRREAGGKKEEKKETPANDVNKEGGEAEGTSRGGKTGDSSVSMSSRHILWGWYPGKTRGKVYWVKE